MICLSECPGRPGRFDVRSLTPPELRGKEQKRELVASLFCSHRGAILNRRGLATAGGVRTSRGQTPERVTQPGEKAWGGELWTSATKSALGRCRPALRRAWCLARALPALMRGGSWSERFSDQLQRLQDLTLAVRWSSYSGFLEA